MSADLPQEPAPEPRPTERIEVRAVPFDASAPNESGARTMDAPPSDAPPSPPPTPPQSSGSGAPPPRDHTWAMACHLVSLVDLALPMFMIGVLAPLVVWLAKKDQDPEVDFHGKESLNFQLNLLVWTLVALVLCCCLIGIPLLMALPIAKLVLVILASIRASRGERYEYPFIFRVIR